MGSMRSLWTPPLVAGKTKEFSETNTEDCGKSTLEKGYKGLLNEKRKTKS